MCAWIMQPVNEAKSEDPKGVEEFPAIVYCNRLFGKIMGVETLATQGDEQRPLAQGAGVGTDCRDLEIAADQTGIEHLRQVGKPEGHHLNDSINVCNAAATVSRSL